MSGCQPSVGAKPGPPFDSETSGSTVGSATTVQSPAAGHPLGVKPQNQPISPVVEASHQPAVVPVQFSERPAEISGAIVCRDPIAESPELEIDQLVSEVLRRNPTLEAMIAAWQAAAARYPQVISLEDPMLMLAMGPGTFGDPNHDVAWMIEGSQKIPWCGKRELRGQQAQAEASAARWDVGDAELRLVEAAKLALLEYYLARRDLELNDEGLRATQGFREDADAKYRASLVTQQDLLQADLELNELRRRKLELERLDRVAIARINTLLHLPVDHQLPPPKRLSEMPPAPPLETVRQLAADRRPDLMALGARLRAEQTALALAEREYYPDLNVVGRYDGFWQRADRNLAPMVGVNLNAPLDNERRRAAIREAQARLAQRRAEFDAKLDEVHADIEIAYQQLQESRRVNELYNEKIIPVAEQNLESARTNYVAAKIDFLRLIEADRQLIMLREKHEEALADYHRRLANLERAAGGPINFQSLESIPKPSSK